MITIGRDTISTAAGSTEREWLVTNGIGGFACGTLSGVLTRRYHGLLVAALNPPLGRTVLVSKVDETATYGDTDYPLFSNQWAQPKEETATPTLPLASSIPTLLPTPHGLPKPDAYKYLDNFCLEGTTPVWTYSFADTLLEKRVWMEHGANTTYLRYTMRRGSMPMKLSIKIVVNYKDFHANVTAGDWKMQIATIKDGLQVNARPEATPYRVWMVGNGTMTPQHTWYQGYFLDREAYRGQDDTGDHLLAGIAETELYPGEPFTLIFSSEPHDEPPTIRHVVASLQRTDARQRDLLGSSRITDAPDWIGQLTLAADQFIVQRKTGENHDGRTVIAGYHWFSDWGRDTMISLPGLTLTTGRDADAASILRTFAHYVDQGMLPNRFPDEGEKPEYNTVDATLWYFEAVRQYIALTDDLALLRDLFPVLEDIVRWHIKGTRYNIHADHVDGLIYAGEKGAQLTWMDAKIGDWVITPRTGKAVEINALWYNALSTLADLAEQIGELPHYYRALAEHVRVHFEKFWNAEAGCCYDVIETPEGNDATLRPNQLFAVSLHRSPLTHEQQKSIVNVCARKLLTPHGLRSLTPDHPEYAPVYGGDAVKRDSKYHQGTVWGWLIGAFVEAHYKVYQNAEVARSFLAPFEHHLRQGCVGSIAEIFDAEPPFYPRGAVAQAWSVAEVLRAWALTAEVDSA